MATVSPGRRTPVVSAAVVAVAALVLAVVLWLVYVSDEAASLSVFIAAGVVGTLILLVAYVLATIGVARLLFFSGTRQVAAWEFVVPALALALLAYTLYKNVYPFPSGKAAVPPLLAVAWLAIGVAYVVAVPRAAKRAGEKLTADEGLAPEVKESV